MNGKKAGVLVAPPWRLDVGGMLEAGENRFEVLVYNTLANHYQTIPSRYRGSPVSGLLGPVRLLSRDWDNGEIYGAETGPELSAKPVPVKAQPTVSTVDGVRITVATGSLKDFDRNIGTDGNLVRNPGLVKQLLGTRSHEGGGGGFAALFNGTVGNGKGGTSTENDGRTFVGMAKGNTLDVVFDPAKSPRGVSVNVVRTYAGHHDARASQNYRLYAAAVGSPGEFVEIAEVRCEHRGGLTEVAFAPAEKRVLADGVGRLRFVFENGSAGFNVYREIAVFGGP